MRKSEVLMHPIRMRIALTLMDKVEEGMTTSDLIKHLNSVSQATLYRHIQIMKDAGVLKTTKEVQIRGIREKYYSLDEGAFKISNEDWNDATIDKRIDSVSFYQLFLLNKYQNYLSKFIGDDKATFSVVNLSLKEETFNNFQDDINELFSKYYSISKENNSSEKVRTVAITIIPE